MTKKRISFALVCLALLALAGFQTVTYSNQGTFNVLAYGADATATTDSTTAFQNALTALNTYAGAHCSGNTSSGKLIIPPGAYLVRSLTWNSGDIEGGDSMDKVSLIWNGSSGGTMITKGNSPACAGHVGIRGITFSFGTTKPSHYLAFPSSYGSDAQTRVSYIHFLPTAKAGTGLADDGSPLAFYADGANTFLDHIRFDDPAGPSIYQAVSGGFGALWNLDSFTYANSGTTTPGSVILVDTCPTANSFNPSPSCANGGTNPTILMNISNARLESVSSDLGSPNAIVFIYTTGGAGNGNPNGPAFNFSNLTFNLHTSNLNTLLWSDGSSGYKANYCASNVWLDGYFTKVINGSNGSDSSWIPVSSPLGGCNNQSNGAWNMYQTSINGRVFSTNPVFTIGEHSDTFNRLSLNGDGSLQWGSGSAAWDVGLSRLFGTTLSIDHASAGDAGGNLALAEIRTETSSNNDLAGTLTMSTGTGSYSFVVGAFIAVHPSCQASDETSIAPVKVSYTGHTAVNFATSGASDVIDYTCIFHN